jgi:hypothetical protein
MPATSEARIAANRANSLHSTGPKTPSGKSNSRRNGLKHGMTGAGIVMTQEDATEVSIRTEGLIAELDPKSIMGKVLVGQIATLSVRMERGASHEEEAIASRVRHATETFDHNRIDAVEYLFNSIADDPRGNLIVLRRLPEGVDRLIEGWARLREVLTRGEVPIFWGDPHQALLANLVGLRAEEAKGTRDESLSMAVRSHCTNLTDSEWKSLDGRAKRLWARDRLLERIDQEIATLKQHRQTLNLKAVELDRLGAAKLAFFDTSRDGALARRYEADARRGFFKAWKEFQQVEAEVEAVEQATSMPVQEPESVVVAPPLASSCAAPSPTPREPKPAPRKKLALPIEGDFSVARGLDGRTVSIGKAAGDPR